MRMLAHLRPLVGVERSRLEEDGVAHADLADVVEERSALDGVEYPLVGHPELLGDAAGEAGPATRGPLRLGIPLSEHGDPARGGGRGGLPDGAPGGRGWA